MTESATRATSGAGLWPRFTETYRSAPARGSTVTASLIIPAFNEASRLSDGLGRFWEAVASNALDPETTEILFVDDGSSDETADRARRLLTRAPHVRVLRLEEHRGKGASIRLGVAQARASRVGFIDADMAILPWQFPRLIDALDHSEVAIGSRELPGSSVNSGSILRVVGGRGFNSAVNLMTDVDLPDTQCGFKGFRTPAARLLFHCSVIEGFAFDVEVLHLARRLGFEIREIPVHWLRVDGSRIHPFRDPLRMLADVAAARLRIRRPPPIEALIVDRLTPAELDDLGDPGASLLPRPGGGTLVLLPLRGHARCLEIACALREAHPNVAVRDASVSVGDLQRLSVIVQAQPKA